jgi:hypothetical protein
LICLPIAKNQLTSPPSIGLEPFFNCWSDVLAELTFFSPIFSSGDRERVFERDTAAAFSSNKAFQRYMIFKKICFH